MRAKLRHVQFVVEDSCEIGEGGNERREKRLAQIRATQIGAVKPGDRFFRIGDIGGDFAVLVPTIGLSFLARDNMDRQFSASICRAFNEWLDEDWGFAYQERVYSAPAIPVLDPVLATEELDRVLARGAPAKSRKSTPRTSEWRT